MGFSSRVLVVAVVVVGLVMCGAQAAHADTIWDESVDGEFASGLPFTDLGTLGVGTHEIIGTVDYGHFIFVSDNFTFMLGTGLQITNVTVTLTNLSKKAYFNSTFFASTLDANGTYSASSGVPFTGTQTPNKLNLYGPLPFTAAGATNWGITTDTAGGSDYTITIEVSSVVPEPGTWALMGLGVLGLAYQRRRKMRAKAS